MQAAQDSAAILAAYSKDQLAGLCRAAGWQGDDARTPKAALAEWYATHGDPSIDKAIAQPQPIATPAAAAQPNTNAAPAIVADAPHAAPTEQKNAGAVAAAIAAALASVKLGADPEEIRAIVREELAGIQPARILIDAQTQHTVKIEEHTHPQFLKVYMLLKAGLNVLLVGPAGCGKTYMLHALAKAMESSKVAIVSGTAGASEAHLTGWRLPVDGGKWDFIASPWLEAYTADKGFCGLDEMDAFDANMLMVSNTALANGHIHVPQALRTFARGKDTVVCATANTYGHGSDLIYAGRNQLDAATLDRFYMVEMDYDEEYEAALAGRAFSPAAPWKAAEKPGADELRNIGVWVAELRKKTESLRLRRVVSTRMLQKAIAARSVGVPFAEVKRDLLAGWTKDELSKVRENA